MDAVWQFIKDNAAAIAVVTGGIAALAGVASVLVALLKRSGKPSPDRMVEVGGDQIEIEKALIASVEKSAGELVYSRHQLRKPSVDFTGREEKLEQITAALRGGGAAITASLEGMGGIGKTETALVAANDLVAEGLFPDAQIFIDLQGFTPGSAPKATVEALTELLRPFVPSDTPLPEDEDTLGQLWRAATTDLDMLLFLDNALDEAQLRPLLPHHDRCAIIITSRNRLALEGLSAVDLGVMEEREAIELALKLANRRDAGRLTNGQAEDLAELCGRLPMAIEIAANTLAVASGWATAEFLTALADRSKTFDMLQHGDRSLKASLGVSLDTLKMESRVRWQILGVFERGFDAFVAGALWKIEDPQPILAELEARSLVNFNKEANRHHLHDLLRALALEELSQDTERETEVYHRHAALFLMVLQAADELFNRGHDAVARGLAILDRELANIRAGQRRSASRADESDEAAGLARGYPHFHCLRLRLLPDEYIGWLEAALAAALKLRDRKAEAIARGNLGISYSTKGDLDAAEEMYRKSLAIDEEMGHREGMANQFGNLGILYSRRGDLDAAEEMFGKSLTINEELSDRRGMAIQYSGFGILYSKRGDFDAAEEMYRKSLAIEEALGHTEGMASDYGNLGNLYRTRGDFDAAGEMFRKSLALFDELGAVDRIEHVEGLLRQLDELRKQT